MACAGHGEPEPDPEPEPCVRIQLHRLRRARTMRRCDILLLLCHMIMPISMVNIDVVCFSRSAGRKFSRKEFHTHRRERRRFRKKNTRVKVTYVGSCQRIFPPAGLRTVWLAVVIQEISTWNFSPTMSTSRRRYVPRHWHKTDRKEQQFYNWASFSHRATAESMCVQGFSLLLVFLSFSLLTVVCWEIAEGTRDKMLANTWQAPRERESLWQSSSSTASPA